MYFYCKYPLIFRPILRSAPLVMWFVQMSVVKQYRDKNYHNTRLSAARGVWPVNTVEEQ